MESSQEDVVRKWMGGTCIWTRKHDLLKIWHSKETRAGNAAMQKRRTANAHVTRREQPTQAHLGDETRSWPLPPLSWSLQEQVEQVEQVEQPEPAHVLAGAGAVSGELCSW